MRRSRSTGPTRATPSTGTTGSGTAGSRRAPCASARRSGRRFAPRRRSGASFFSVDLTTKVAAAFLDPGGTALPRGARPAPPPDRAPRRDVAPPGRRRCRAAGPVLERRRLARHQGPRRLLPLERRPLRARHRSGADRRLRRPRARRRRPRLSLPRWDRRRQAARRRPDRGATPGAVERAVALLRTPLPPFCPEVF